MLSVAKSILLRVLSIYTFKRKKVTCDSKFVSHRANIGRGTVICRDTELDALCDIGRHVYIGKRCNLTKSTVGNYCSIANNVSIGQGEHDLSLVSTSSLFYDDAYNKLTKDDCVIGNDVWLGVGATIRRGVKIGNGAVVGAHTVVTKDVPSFAIVAGVPGKIIRYRFSERKIHRIESSSWWDLDVKEARGIMDQIESENNL